MCMNKCRGDKDRIQSMPSEIIISQDTCIGLLTFIELFIRTSHKHTKQTNMLTQIFVYECVYVCVYVYICASFRDIH